MRVKIHKALINALDKWNISLTNDEYIGRDRFGIEIYKEEWEQFEDGSGEILELVLKMYDRVTGNTACFMCNDYDYEYKIPHYLNDFLVRCSSGHSAHYPLLYYVIYDVHKIVPYAKENRTKSTIEPGVIDKYNWLEDTNND